MIFDFQSAGRIAFGPGRVQELGREARALGQRGLLVTGRAGPRARSAELLLEAAGIDFEVVRAEGEPTVEQARLAAERGRAFGASFVVAHGGGSAIDLAKATAALIPAADDVLEYLEVIGRGRPLQQAALPVLAVPTTAGTGAEVTKNAVLASSEHGVKVSLRHESMLPRLALVDPELLLGCPQAITAASGLDALTQCLEPLVSCKHNPASDAVAAEGLARGARSLARAVDVPDDLEAKSDMALCSVFGGLALANAKLGAVHGFAAPIGGMFESPHGAVCARLLPLVYEVNLRALRNRAPASPLLERFDRVARLLTNQPTARAEQGLEFLVELGRKLAVPGLATYGMRSSDLELVAEKAQRASSMAGNPLPLSSEELLEILERAL